MTKIEIEDVMKLGQFQVLAHGKDGKAYVLNQRFPCDDPRIRPLLQKIEECGKIDLRFWTLRKGL